jgi:hypothetical protein
MPRRMRNRYSTNDPVRSSKVFRYLIVILMAALLGFYGLSLLGYLSID